MNALQHFPDLELTRTASVRVLLLTGYGLNCEAETEAAFSMLGAKVDRVHLSDYIAGTVDLERYGLMTFIGGFSFGDHIASGRIQGNRIRFRRGEDVQRFVDRGGLALGMCNGFQTMVKLGLLPALGREAGQPLAEQGASLLANERLGYRNGWVRLLPDPDSPCVFTRGLEPFDCPSRHAEGKVVFKDSEYRRRVEAAHLVPVRYVDASGRPTQAWPENPNGSSGGVAGLCDPSGRIFGLMPHPEAYLYPENHPRWIQQRDAGELPPVGRGLQLFANALRALC